MGKFKDKLYYFAVLKKPEIRKEYQKYVNNDQRNHTKSRLSSLKVLFRLNIHYRLLRKNVPLLNDFGASEGKKLRPEGELPLMCAEELAKILLSEGEVISFDVFDTLLLRPFEDPKELFKLLEKEFDIKGFYDIRIDAEQRARMISFKKNGSYEVNIEDIYKLVSEKTGLDPAVGITKEFEFEKSLCFPNEYFKKVFDILKAERKRIIISSDMYLHKEEIGELLENCGFSGYEKIYVSCDVGASKSEGSLYELIKSELRTSAVFHVGDNYHSDVISSRRHGLKAYYYQSSM